MGIFKAYDVRGIYGEELNDELAYAIGRAFITHTKAKEVLIGADSRLSSPKLKAALIKGIIDQGGNAIDIGLTTTPMLRYLHRHLGQDAAIQVTASHNPKAYGGFKFFGEKGRIINGGWSLPDIERLVKENTFAQPETKGTAITRNYLQDYVQLLKDLIKEDLTDLYVVVDASNGPVGTICEPLFDELGIQYAELNFEPDGNFPGHDPNPIKKASQEQARRKVREIGADFGCIFDADADRIFFVDEEGRTIEPELIAAAIATHLLKQEPGAEIVYDCFSSHVLHDATIKAGGKPTIYRTGSAYIYDYAKEHDVPFCAEASSHYLHRNVYYIDHGLYTLLTVMALVVNESKPLSAIIEPFNTYLDSGQLVVHVDDSAATIKKVKDHYAKEQQWTVDGVSISYPDNSWFIVRPSNTEPLLRVRAQAKDQQRLDAIKQELEHVIGAPFEDV